MDLITISGVRGYIDENGVAQLSLDDCSRGLGFTTVATSGNEAIRWTRVRGYLEDLNHICGDDNIPEFIPENIFYRLAMKAKNQAAEAFQAKVADEILPSIRKHGAYMTPATIDKMIASPEFGIKLLSALQEERARNEQLASTLAIAQPKAKSWDMITDDESLLWTWSEAAKAAAVPGLGPRRLKEIADTLGWLCKDGTCTMKAQRDGLVRTIMVEVSNIQKVVPVVKLRPKGLDRLVKEYKKSAGDLWE